ncbi:hypothetical protein G9A89_010294 [Geosiphon pyriformis]|nr:hypothetical protein G9A89_010294 [Geosiphon pyriformis]
MSSIQKTCICYYCNKQGHLQFECYKKISNLRSANHNAANLSNPNNAVIIFISSILVSSINLSTNNTHNLSTIAATNNLSNTNNLNPKLSLDNIKKSQIQSHSKLEIGNSFIRIMPAEFKNQNYLSLLITPEDALFNNTESNQKQPLINNILLAIITNNELLTWNHTQGKTIIIMYTNAKINGHFIKLILNSRSAGSHQINCAASTRIITTNEVTKTPIGEIDNFLFKVNGIIIPIKVLVIEATQYQACVGNDWLFKTNTMLD